MPSVVGTPVNGNAQDQTSLTVAITIPGGSNLCVWIIGQIFGASFTTCTVNGTDCGAAFISDSTSDSIGISAWRLVAPTTGNIVLSAGASATELALVAWVTDDTHQTTPYTSAVSTNVNSTSISQTVTGASEDLVCGGLVIYNPNTLTNGADQTTITEVVGGGSITSVRSSQEASGASITHSYSWTGTNTAALVAWNVETAGGGGGGGLGNYYSYYSRGIATA